MNDVNEKSKDLGKAANKGQAVKAEASDEDLEPCDKPQAQEALRFSTVDEACDDGVD